MEFEKNFNKVYTLCIRGIYDMLVKIRKIGNSLVSTLPKEIVSKTKIEDGSVIEVEVQDEETVVLRLKKESEPYLKMLFENYDGVDDPKEFSWDDSLPKGNEVW